jgi:hypothetical protein
MSVLPAPVNLCGAAHQRRSVNFTGVNFSPDRHTLFANIQDEEYVFAITGPFALLRRS